jgi:hypothetical protein
MKNYFLLFNDISTKFNVLFHQKSYRAFKIMKELSNNEINLISGAFGTTGAGLSVLTGGASYLGGAATSGSFNWANLVIATGALGGPVTSAASRY